MLILELNSLQCNISGKRQKGTGCGAVVVLLNWAVCLALLYWFSGFWIPFAMKVCARLCFDYHNIELTTL